MNRTKSKHVACPRFQEYPASSSHAINELQVQEAGIWMTGYIIGPIGRVVRVKHDDYLPSDSAYLAL